MVSGDDGHLHSSLIPLILIVSRNPLSCFGMPGASVPERNHDFCKNTGQKAPAKQALKSRMPRVAVPVRASPVGCAEVEDSLPDDAVLDAQEMMLGTKPVFFFSVMLHFPLWLQ